MQRRIDRAGFFTGIRGAGKLFPTMNQSQVDGINAILDEWDKNWSDKDPRWLAYMLATTYHETGRTMRPIEEYGKGKGRPYGKRLKMSGAQYVDTTNIFYGRGFVQLTWYENYQKAGNKLGIDLINNPGLALQLQHATPIMFYGMVEGWFTGRRLDQYLSPAKNDFKGARAIINGKDKAELIAGYADNFIVAIK